MLFAFLSFFWGQSGRPKRYPIYGDEYMMGNWTIIEEDFSGDFLGKYQLMLLPHESEDALIGKIYVVKTRRIIEKNNITLRFSGENREVFCFFFCKQKIKKLNLSIGNNILMQAF